MGQQYGAPYQQFQNVYDLLGKNREGADRVSIIANYIGCFTTNLGTLGHTLTLTLS